MHFFRFGHACYSIWLVYGLLLAICRNAQWYDIPGIQGNALLGAVVMSFVAPLLSTGLAVGLTVIAVRIGTKSCTPDESGPSPDADVF